MMLRNADRTCRPKRARILASLGVLAASGLLATAALAEETRTLSMRELMAREAQRSEPDYLAYVPGSWDGTTNDSHNEHFLVFEGSDGSLMAVWTQSLIFGEAKNRIVFSRTDDGGKTWAEPTHVVGPRTPDDPTEVASWAFPMVSKSGRIYVLYNQNQGNQGWIKMHTGTMDGVYSDDLGRTWSERQQVPMPRSPYDDPEGKIPGEWIVWQNPMRDLSGGYFVGYTRWVNYAVTNRPDAYGWTQIESVVEFVRFENIDDDPEPKDIRTSYSAWGEKALRVPHFKYPELSVAQEPSIVRLPDDRLFCVMRTNSGYIWYSVSQDDGRTWINPRPLLRKDFGQPILQPVSCCPIYRLADGRYALFHHNNRGDIESHPEATHSPRRPVFLALGEFRPDADQPIWFSRSKQLADNDNRGSDGLPMGESALPWTNIGVYSSFTTKDGDDVFWHCDRKVFLVGKRITDDFLADLKVPKP